MDKRFIEESFPVKEVSEESTKEKNVRLGNISTLHIWWARRPLASSRTTNYAALIPAPKDEIDWVKKRNFIIELSKWENSLNHNLIEKARKDILKSNNGIPPRVLDPFSGGGAIPLEAQRLGCETYANDYNPVAVLIEKCTAEYPQKYGNIKDVKWSEGNNKLLDDFKKWGNWILEETRKEIHSFYPDDKNGLIPISYLWAKTVNCQNPSCNSEIPLIRQYWLSNKKNKKVSLYPYIKNSEIKFKIVGDGYQKIPEGFDPSKGTISKSIINCPVCGSNIDAKLTRKLFGDKKSGERMLAVVLINPRKKGRIYRIVNNNDLIVFNETKSSLNEIKNELKDNWGMEPIPNEPLPPIGTLGFRVQRYGVLTWGDLFNSRQKLTLLTFIKNIHKAHKIMVSEGYDKEYSKVITTYLALLFTRTVDFSSNLARWKPDAEALVQSITRQTLSMVFDYTENNIIGDTAGTWKSLLNRMSTVIPNLSFIEGKANITQSSATQLPYQDNFFDAVFTDPPYYDNIPYSHLSDFFYVWLKRAVGNLYPDLFSTPLTPKSKEIVAYTHEKTWDEAKIFFENMLSESFQEIERVLKPEGIATIVYAHKTTEGWETVINAILNSGLTVTASWPVSTEMRGRLRAQNSAALASSIYIVARKLKKTDLGWYKDVKAELKKYIPNKLNKLWEEGISGADFFISAIGSAIEVFGKYKMVLDNEGNEIRADKLLSFVRDVVSDYTVRQILHNGIADELSPLTKFYLMWRWNYQEARIPFDDARKLAQSAGIDLVNEWNKGFVIKRSSFITIQGPDKRDKKLIKDSDELIDVLHYICLLWKDGKKDEMKFVLKKSGYGEGETIYKVAQAISETLPNSSSEKKMIEGFLASRDKIMQDMRDDESQTKLV